jgi:hypothetical protein
MRKLVIGSGATLIAIGGVLAANAEPVTGAGAVQVTEKTSAAPTGVHKLSPDTHIKFDAVTGDNVQKNKLSSESKWKADNLGVNKLTDAQIKQSPSSERGIDKASPNIMKATPKGTVPQSDTFWK